MKLKQVLSVAALSVAMFTGGAAFSQNSQVGEFYPFAEIMSMKMMDKNKDGMVSKKEFMDMMSMAWDMNAKKMKVKGEKMTFDEFKEILMYLKAGS